MATLPESVDYTDKDFDALRARLIALIKSVFPDWTDFDVASFGNLLVELYAYVGDVLTFYQDNLARESRLVTATQRSADAEGEVAPRDAGVRSVDCLALERGGERRVLGRCF